MPYIDAHCHLLTRHDIVHELYAVLSDGKELPSESEHVTRPTVPPDAPWHVRLLAKAEELLGGAFDSGEQLYEKEKDGCEASAFGSRDLAIVPLIMDIRYMLHKPDEQHDAKIGQPLQRIVFQASLHPEQFASRNCQTRSALRLG